MKKATRLFIAFFRLNKRIVCEESVGRGLHNDFHDYMDTEDQYPAHFTTLTCARCGKDFTI